MLSLSCRRFRMDFTPGADHPHRQSCAACAAYAAAMERAAKKAPLPARLRSKLRAVPATRQDDAPRLLVPRAPLPAPLRERLRQMSRRREARPPLPAWVRSSRYAVAASYLLTVLLGAAIGNPVEAAGSMSRVSRSVDRAVRPRVERALEGVESRGLRQLDDLESTVWERYGATRSFLEQSLGNLEARVHELDSLRKSLFSLDRLTDWNEGD
jgi:hypothetical protein